MVSGEGLRTPPSDWPEKAEPYRVSFNITGPDPAGLDLLGRVEERIRHWLAGRSQQPQFDAPSGSWSDDDYEISIDRDSLGDSGYVSFKWECEDRRAPGFWLRLDADLVTEGGPVALSIESYFLEQDDTDPPDLLAGPPPLVHELLDTFDCFMDEERIRGEVAPVSPEEAPQLAAGRILSPERCLPIVAVSQDWQGNTAVDPARLQRTLAGAATVVVYGADAAQVLRQREHVGPALACYNGAVRVYWPGCATVDQGGVHKVWMRGEAESLGFRLNRQLQGECLRRLAPGFDRQMFESIRWRIDRETMRSRLLEFEEQNRQLQEEQESAAETEARIVQLQGQLAAMDAENRRLTREQQDKDHLQREHDAASRQIAELQESIEDIRVQIAVKEEEIQHLQRERESAERPSESASIVLADEQQRILAELKRQLSRKTEEITAFGTANVDLRTRLAEEQRLREQDDDESNKIITQLEADKENLIRQLNDKGADNRQLQNRHISDVNVREKSNNDRVGQGLWLLRTGLAYFVPRRVVARYPGSEALRELRRIFPDGADRDELEQQAKTSKSYFEWMDSAALLKVVSYSWKEVFRNNFNPAERDCVKDLRDFRNKWAHQRSFSNDEAYLALESIHRILSVMGSPQTGEVDDLKMEQFRVAFDTQIEQIVNGSRGSAPAR